MRSWVPLPTTVPASRNRSNVLTPPVKLRFTPLAVYVSWLVGVPSWLVPPAEGTMSFAAVPVVPVSPPPWRRNSVGEPGVPVGDGVGEGPALGDAVGDGVTPPPPRSTPVPAGLRHAVAPAGTDSVAPSEKCTVTAAAVLLYSDIACPGSAIARNS